MSILNFFLSRNKNTAYIAKKRLQMIFNKQDKNVMNIKNFTNLKKELYFIINKYMIDKKNSISVRINQNTSNTLILELNIIVPN